MRLEAVLGDITRERVDAIVNAANCSVAARRRCDPSSRRAGARRIFGYPLEEATDIAVATGRSTPTSVTTVRFVCFDGTTLEAYAERLERTS